MRCMEENNKKRKNTGVSRTKVRFITRKFAKEELKKQKLEDEYWDE